MMGIIEWFSDIDLNSSEKFRMLLLIVTSTIAILVVLINQAFNNGRESRALEVEKLELLYQTASNMELAIDNLYAVILEAHHGLLSQNAARPYHELEKIINDEFVVIKNANQKIVMLCNLYFKSFNVGYYYDSVNRAFSILDLIITEKDDRVRESAEAEDRLKEFIKIIKEMCVIRSSKRSIPQWMLFILCFKWVKWLFFKFNRRSKPTSEIEF